jgi:hypothetical protein
MSTERLNGDAKNDWSLAKACHFPFRAAYHLLSTTGLLEENHKAFKVASQYSTVVFNVWWRGRL